MRRSVIGALFGVATAVSVLLVGGATQEQEKAQSPTSSKAPAVKAKVSDFAWMSGTWRGKDEKSEFEETWSSVANGSIIGMFRMGAGDKSTFFEFETLTQEGDEVVLRIRHYREKMVDADAAPMVWSVAKLAANEVVFECPGDGFVRRLAYRREGDRLTAHVESKHDGKPFLLDMKFERAK